MAEEATVGYTYSEKPKQEYEVEYTYKPEQVPDIKNVPTHRILHAIASSFPAAASRLGHGLIYQSRTEHPHTRNAILSIGSSFLGLEAGVAKTKLMQLEMKEASGVKLTPYELQRKTLLQGYISRAEMFKKAIDSHKAEIEKPEYDKKKLEQVV
jgi:hypothetical protein